MCYLLLSWLHHIIGKCYHDFFFMFNSYGVWHLLYFVFWLFITSLCFCSLFPVVLHFLFLLLSPTTRTYTCSQLLLAHLSSISSSAPVHLFFFFFVHSSVEHCVFSHRVWFSLHLLKKKKKHDKGAPSVQYVVNIWSISFVDWLHSIIILSGRYFRRFQYFLVSFLIILRS